MNLAQQAELMNRVQGMGQGFYVKRRSLGIHETFVAHCTQCKTDIPLSDRVLSVVQPERGIEYVVSTLAAHRQKCTTPEVMFAVKQQPTPEPAKPYSRKFDL